jgi:hypothetical protein
VRSLAVAALVSAACNPAGVQPDATAPDASSVELLLDPPVLLDFGEVPGEREAMQAVTVTAGGDTLVIDSIRLAAGSRDKWRFEADGELSSGLSPGSSAQVRVYFRSCPEAWSGDRIDPAFDFSACYGRVSAGSLELSGNAGRRSVSLSGRAAQPPPALSVEPQDGLHFGWRAGEPQQSWVWLNLINLGHATLVVDEVEIRQSGYSFYFFDGCGTTCSYGVSLCRFDDPTCQVRMLSLHIAFSPPQDALEVEGEIAIRSNDPAAPELVLPLRGATNSCPWPSALDDQERPWIRTNQELALDAYLSLPGAEAIAGYRWSVLGTSSVAPVLSGSDQRRVGFTASEPGFYLVGLDVLNSCGAWTESPHVTVIRVQE